MAQIPNDGVCLFVSVLYMVFNKLHSDTLAIYLKPNLLDPTELS